MSSRRRSTRRSRYSDTTTLIFLLVLGAIFLYNAWQESSSPPDEGAPAGVVTQTSAQPGQRIATLDPGAEGIEVFFTDPLSGRKSGGIENELIRAIDGAQKTLDIAIYNFTIENVGDAVLRAKRRGVAVRMVMESEALDKELPETLNLAGIPMVGDQREGLMHNKFIIIDGQEVWTGSMNLTSLASYNDFNNLVRLRSQRIAQNYTVEFEEMFLENLFGANDRPATPYPEVTVDGVKVEVYFSPDDKVASQVIPVLQSADRSINFMAYSFTRDDFGEVIQQRAAAGVTVRGVFDESQVKSNRGGEYDILQQAGLDVKLDGISGLLHHKVFIIDGEVVVTGSYNFSANAERTNDENLIIIHDPRIAQMYLQEFEKVYANAK